MKSIVGENWSGTSIWVVGFFEEENQLKTFNPRNTIDTAVVSIRRYSVDSKSIGTVLPFRIQLKTF